MADKISATSPIGLVLQHLLASYKKSVNEFVVVDFDGLLAGGDVNSERLLDFLASEVVEGCSSIASDDGHPQALVAAHQDLLQMIDSTIADLQALRELCAAPSSSMRKMQRSLKTMQAVEEAIGVEDAPVARIKPSAPAL